MKIHIKFFLFFFTIFLFGCINLENKTETEIIFLEENLPEEDPFEKIDQTPMKNYTLDDLKETKTLKEINYTFYSDEDLSFLYPSDFSTLIINNTLNFYKDDYNLTIIKYEYELDIKKELINLKKEIQDDILFESNISFKSNNYEFLYYQKNLKDCKTFFLNENYRTFYFDFCFDKDNLVYSQNILNKLLEFFMVEPIYWEKDLKESICFEYICIDSYLFWYFKENDKRFLSTDITFTGKEYVLNYISKYGEAPNLKIYELEKQENLKITNQEVLDLFCDDKNFVLDSYINFFYGDFSIEKKRAQCFNERNLFNRQIIWFFSEDNFKVFVFILENEDLNEDLDVLEDVILNSKFRV